MGRGGRRRHTTKTGGSAKVVHEREVNEEDEGDMLRFDQDDDASTTSGSDDNSVDESGQGVLDIDRPTGKEESSDSVSSSEDDEEEEEEEDMVLPESEDDLGEEDDEEIDIRDWGNRKSSYYNGDTADLELGQEEQDAFDEEEAAMEVEASRFKSMTDEDFMLSDTEETAEELEGSEGLKTGKASTQDKRRHLNEKHPELLPLLSHFSQTAAEYHNGTSVAVKAIFESSEEGTSESIGINKAGTQFLLTKALLEASASLNVAVYMLLKHAASSTGGDDDDHNPMPTHPIVSRLASLNRLLEVVDTMSERSDGALRGQMQMVVKAAASLGLGGEAYGESNEEGSSSEGEEAVGETAGDNRDNARAVNSNSDGDSSSDDASSSDDDDDKATISQSVLNEARFGLRPGEIAVGNDTAPKFASRVVVDAGDTADDGGKVMKRLASTLNSINQRTSSKKKKAVTAVEAEDIDDFVDRPHGKGHGDDEDDFDPAKNDILFRRPAPAGDDDEANDLDDFYSQAEEASKKRKKAKQDIYGAQPKFPRMDTEVQGERAVSRQILKNRGLVAHKNKINRNPRVKKREKYRRALIQRHGAVRSVRTDEGHRYGGEETGIKSNISRSRKLAK